MKKFKALIVDDEPLACDEIQFLLEDFPEIEVIGEVNNIDAAKKFINDKDPDLIFLDIQLPGESGFDLLNKVDIRGHVVFVTAYDEYAVRAFEVNALDYLLKPVNPKRLEKTIKRYINSKNDSLNIIKKLEYDDSIFLRIDHSIKFIKLNSIIVINAEADYSQIVTLEGKQGLVLKSLKEWQSILPEKYFYRIHRSTIINCNYVKKVEKWFKSSYHIYLKDLDEPVIMSRRMGTRFLSQFKL